MIFIIDCSQASLIGDGFCNDETNNVECNFDGWDCCPLCEAIIVTFEDGAQEAHGAYQGMYNKSSIVNGKPSWTAMYTVQNWERN